MALTEAGESISPALGLIFVFNLIVGTGALTMPKAFSAAGWLLSLILIIALAFMSYVTVTFTGEAMSLANGYRRWLQGEDGNIQTADPGTVSEYQPDGANSDERAPLLNQGKEPVAGQSENSFRMIERIEMGPMASLFFNKAGVIMFNIIMAIYLYGDLAIYAAAVPKSLRNVACTYTITNDTNITRGNDTWLTEDDPCWENAPSISRMNGYRIFVGCFTLLLGPFIFFDVQKTKYLQVFTSIMRWTAFGMMVILAAIYLAEGHGHGHPKVANFKGIPTLFGVCVYSFMCHHSLPSLITPIKDKSKLYSLLAGDYMLILVFYCLLSFTGIFSFDRLQDLYTLNFEASSFDPSEVPITNVQFIQYFLALFPVFTLSTNFPIIGITLRNNLKTMFLSEDKSYSFFFERISFPLLTIIPPVVIAFVTLRIDFLVGVTGSYAGAGIQYIVPAFLVWAGRRKVRACMGEGLVNPHQSPFKHNAWVYFVLTWAFVCIGIVTVNHIIVGF